jgi:arylsulfatase A-like enzyme
MKRLGQNRRRPCARLPIAAGLLCLLCAAALSLSLARPAAAEITPPKPGQAPPNFVVIQTDDQTLDGLYATFHAFPGVAKTRAMPNTLDLIGKRGMTFNRYYVPYPLCCPSRTSLLTGRYSHNNGVKGNNPPSGGYTGFSFRAAATHNIATWLQGSGYRTVHVGKVLNGYGEPPFSAGLEVPPGWSSWYGLINEDRTHYYYGYTLNVNGRLIGPFGDRGDWNTRKYGVRDDVTCPAFSASGLPCFHVTDKLSEIAANEIRATPRTQPFYVQLDYAAPHGDFRQPAGPEPAPRHYDWFKGARRPHNRSQGFDEGNVSDKPRFIREAPHLTPIEKRIYRVYYEKQLDSLRSVDDGVKTVLDAIGQTHRLRNTYVLFISDNGFFFGEHRLLGGKFLAYEPATHLPFLISGPGIRPGSKTGELAANIDVAPTLLELAGVEPDKSIDGRSLVPYLEDEDLRSRRPILFESFVETYDAEANGAPRGNGGNARASATRGHSGKATPSILAPPKDYAGIRLGPYKYIAWPSGEKELYNINKDPYELNSLHRNPNFFPIRNFLHRQMKRLTECFGRECRKTTPPLRVTRREFQRLQAKKRREQRQRAREKARRERERKR